MTKPHVAQASTRRIMFTVTKAQLHQFLENGEDYEKYADFREQVADVNGEKVLIDEAAFAGLKDCDFRKIVVGSHLSENHLGGDDLVTVADDVLRAVEEHYQVVTWYGPNTQALIAGYHKDQLTIKD
jgi:hypothetical protein